jgi:hypothetical protein
MSVQVERPRTLKGARALVRKRKQQIASLEKALSVRGLPAHTRQHLRNNLRGTKMSLQSWVDWIEKKGGE